jgi:type II secretion system protein C
MIGTLLLLLQAAAPDISLAGLVVGRGSGAAILRIDGRQRAVGKGETVYGHKVVEIDASGVWLEKDGQRVHLAPGRAAAPALPPPPPVATAAAAPRAGEETPPKEFARAELEKRLAGEMPRLLAETALMPVTENGRIVGLTVTRMPADSLLHEIGLRAGDVLTEINGVAIDGLPALLSLYPTLQTESRFNAIVLRNGRLTSISALLH